MDKSIFPYPVIENSETKESPKPMKTLRFKITLESVNEFESPDHRTLGAARQREEFPDIGSDTIPPDEG